MKKLLLFFAFVLGSLWITCLPTYALGAEQIQKFDIKTIITRDNTARTVETIVYDFGETSHHGIYRDIPIDYIDGNDKYYLNFHLNSVTDENNNNLQNSASTENGVKRIQIGDPDKTITGVHTYIISYTLSPIILDKAGSPFLNLDVIGKWTVPIGEVSAVVELENSATLQDVSWYGAPNLATESNSFKTDSLGYGSEVTINATLPKNYLQAPYLEVNKKRTEDIVTQNLFIIGGIVVALGVISGLSIFIARRYRTHRRRSAQIVVAQYQPPEGMTPAHIGFLQDDTASNNEITATIISWAVAGYIKIEYIPKKNIFTKKDYRLIKTNLSPDIGSSEKQFFSAIFEAADENGAVLLTKLPALTVASAAITYKDSLKVDLSAKGYYDVDGNILDNGELTSSGAKQWALVDGFRLYLSVVEKDRLKFTDAPDKTPERFNRLLPYAIALGVEKQWAKQFEGIDLAPATTWYAGNFATFSAVSLVSDIGGSFAQTLSSSSTVSSGGGVSGGGFGGGGGGSW